MLINIALFLAAAVVFVPLFKRIGLGAILGYLAAGVLLGPSGLSLISDVDQILHVSELGVILLLFIIGLELQPSRLWTLRRRVFGAGSLQLVLTGSLLMLMAVLWGRQSWQAALVVGFGLAMSSTAFVLQLLGERNELSSHHGRVSFAILLFQDLSVVPLLALLPLLAGHNAPHQDLAGWMVALRAVVAVVVVILGGRYLLRPILRLLATTRVSEVFTAAALLVVIGTAMAMDAVGLPMSLGAFLAGVLLADSEYRHELQADIEPFKGLLLGLFFIAVGMNADVSQLLVRPWLILALVVVLMTVKAAVLWLVGLSQGLDRSSRTALAAGMAQGGEFAFVLFSAAATEGLLSSRLQAELIVVVTLSMMLTPPLYALQARFSRTRAALPYDEIDVKPSEVLIAGFGPFGQVIGRIIRLMQISYTILDKNADHVAFVRQFGTPVFYSDASRIEVLRAAHAGEARLFVIAIADEHESLRVAEVVRRHFPSLPVVAAARTRGHAIRLMDLGVHKVVRRSLFSSLEAARSVLAEFGYSEPQARSIVERFRQHDQETLLKQQATARDDNARVRIAQDRLKELEQLFAEDQADQRRVLTEAGNKTEA